MSKRVTPFDCSGDGKMPRSRGRPCPRRPKLTASLQNDCPDVWFRCGNVGAMPIFRKTMVVQLELPSSATAESLPLTTEREFGVYLRSENQSFAANGFSSPINDEQWRAFVRQLRDCNVNHDDSGYRGATAIRSLGRNLYQALCGLSTKLQEFLDATGTPRRLVIQTERPELHLLPWGALYDLEGRLLAAGDLSIVQAWGAFSDAPLPTQGTLNLVRVLGADTNKSTVASLAGLPPEITTVPGGAPDILHMEEHGDVVRSEIGGESSNAMAEEYKSSRLALLWSCYSSAANSWGESPALTLHRAGAGLVLSFQAELHNLDAKSISGAFYSDVFGPAASRDPESALVRIRVDKFAKEFPCANWASMTVYLRGPLDLSALALNGPRVPAVGWTDELPAVGSDAGAAVLAAVAAVTAELGEEVGDGEAAVAGGKIDPWVGLTEAVGRLQPRTLVGVEGPKWGAGGWSAKLPLCAATAWRGNVIRLDGAVEPLVDAVLAELNLDVRAAPKTDAADRLLWFFAQIQHYGSPLIVWTNALPRHYEFVKATGASASLTLLLLYGPDEEPSLAELVDLGRLEEAVVAARALAADCADDEALAAAYFAFSRRMLEEEAKGILARLVNPGERLLLTGNYVSRFGVVPAVGPGGAGEEVKDREVKDLERKHREEDFYRQAMNLPGAQTNLSLTGRAKHELGYLMCGQGRKGTAEIFFRGALQDLERSGEHDTRWHSALARVLRDWADMLAGDAARLEEASALLARGIAIHTFHGRKLEIAYAMTTQARIALSGGRHAEAIEDALEAANRFEECVNWWGWSTAIEILLDALAETRETVRMQAVIHLALEKNQMSNLKVSQKDGVKRRLLFESARAHWIAGHLGEAKKVLDGVFEEAPVSFRESEQGLEAGRLYRFLSLTPVPA